MYDVSRKVEFVKPIRASTRLANKIILDTEIHQYGIYTRSPYVIGCCLWNNLDAETQKLESKLTFKTKIKSLYRLQQNPDT